MLGHLKWRCRRGVRELDLILTHFVDAQRDSLSVDQQLKMHGLLDYSDAELLTWLAGTEAPPDEILSDLVERIRSTIRG